MIIGLDIVFLCAGDEVEGRGGFDGVDDGVGAGRDAMLTYESLAGEANQGEGGGDGVGVDFERIGRWVAAACFDGYSWFRSVCSGVHNSFGSGVLAGWELEALVGLCKYEGFSSKSNSVSARRQASAWVSQLSPY